MIEEELKEIVESADESRHLPICAVTEFQTAHQLWKCRLVLGAALWG